MDAFRLRRCGLLPLADTFDIPPACPALISHAVCTCRVLNRCAFFFFFVLWLSSSVQLHARRRVLVRFEIPASLCLFRCVILSVG